MKEYRIMAYFTDIYSPRSYKRRIYKTKEDAEKDFPEAEQYYHMLASRMRSEGADVKVVIEERETTEWSADSVDTDEIRNMKYCRLRLKVQKQNNRKENTHEL